MTDYAFTKLFANITDSSLWDECHQTRIVWITMLAMANRDGYVGASLPGLAHRSRVTLAECEAALAKFMAPDKYSRTEDNEGRRVERADGGWNLLNYAKYRGMRDDESTRERKRNWMRDQRSKPADDAPDCGRVDSVVDAVDVCGPKQIAEAERDTEAEKEQKHSRSSSAQSPKGRSRKSPEALAVEIPPWLPLLDWQAWVEHRVDIKHPMTTHAAKLVIGELERLRGMGHPPAKVIAKAIMRRWRGVFPLEHGDDGYPAAPKLQANGGSMPKMGF